jgi:anti-sigma B factor antagonist
MKCFEMTKCSQKQRESCFVWNSFRETPNEMESIKCWLLKGGFSEETDEQFDKCRRCPYFQALNQQSLIASDVDANLAVISGEGTINNDRTKALKKTWETLKEHSKAYILLDLSKITNIYSSGLGTIITIHKETQAMGGLLVVLCPDGYVKNLLQVTKLSRILTITSNLSDAKSAITAHRKKREPKPLQESPEKQIPKPVLPKERPSCWVYWNNKNPRNATTCDECFKKLKPSNQPCWIVEGMIEGISFHYINEDCETCPYFNEFGKTCG